MRKLLGVNLAFRHSQPTTQLWYIWSQMTECGFLSYSQMSEWEKSVFRKTTYSTVKIKINV